MQFSIITPSLNPSDSLRLCLASVADQGANVEHLVQDAGSTDGTLDWLREDKRVDLVVGADDGMYDAINRGFKRAQGEIVAWLNCDEQYLPETLNRVAEFFDAHPRIDMVFGDVVLVDEKRRYLCHRRVEPPLLYHTWVCHLSTLSCAMFFRRRILHEANRFMDTTYRCGGDGEWMVRLLRAGIVAGSLGCFTSAFSLHSRNLSHSDRAREEWRRLRQTAPMWARILSPLWIIHHSPFQFSIYTPDSPMYRIEQNVLRPRFRCPIQK